MTAAGVLLDWHVKMSWIWWKWCKPCWQISVQLALACPGHCIYCSSCNWAQMAYYLIPTTGRILSFLMLQIHEQETLVCIGKPQWSTLAIAIQEVQVGVITVQHATVINQSIHRDSSIFISMLTCAIHPGRPSWSSWVTWVHAHHFEVSRLCGLGLSCFGSTQGARHHSGWSTRNWTPASDSTIRMINPS